MLYSGTVSEKSELHVRLSKFENSRKVSLKLL